MLASLLANEFGQVMKGARKEGGEREGRLGPRMSTLPIRGGVQSRRVLMYVLSSPASLARSLNYPSIHICVSIKRQREHLGKGKKKNVFRDVSVTVCEYVPSRLLAACPVLFASLNITLHQSSLLGSGNKRRRTGKQASRRKGR